MDDRHPVRERRFDIGRLLSAAGVVLSLVFVGLQLRDNTAAVRAQARQAIAERSATVIYSVAENPELARAFRLLWGDSVPGEHLSAFDSVQASWAMFGLVRHLENAYLQVQEGVIDRSALDTYGFRNNEWLQTQRFREWWPSVSPRFDERFVSEFEALYGLR